MRRRALRSAAALVVAIGFTAGCAGTALGARAQLGAALEEFGHQFLEAAQLYDSAYLSGAISADQYREWAAAAPALKTAYGRLYAAWVAGDDPAKLREELGRLRIDLAVFLLKARG